MKHRVSICLIVFYVYIPLYLTTAICYRPLSRKVMCHLDSTFKQDGPVLNRVKSNDFSRATTVVHTQAYPIALSMVGISQISMLIARCLPMVLSNIYWFVCSLWCMCFNHMHELDIQLNQSNMLKQTYQHATFE